MWLDNAAIEFAQQYCTLQYLIELCPRMLEKKVIPPELTVEVLSFSIWQKKKRKKASYGTKKGWKFAKREKEIFKNEQERSCNIIITECIGDLDVQLV